MTDEAPKTGPHGGRPRGQHIKVWVNDREKTELADRAALAGVSLSAYLKHAGMRARIKERPNVAAVAELVRVNGDLGRVAGLLKLWLAEKRGQGARPADVEAMMKQFRALQDELRSIMLGMAR